MPEELIDKQQRERCVVPGAAPNVLEADRQAWSLLESVLDRDPIGAWTMTKMEHVVVGVGSVEYTATFERDPDAPAAPLAVREVSDEEVAQALAEDRERAASGRGPRS